MIAESMAHAKPVVATRVGGIPELISDGNSGYLVDRGDTVAMSRRVLELLNDPSARARMGEAGREIVRTKFDLKTNVSQLVESYGIKISEARQLGRATLKLTELALPDRPTPAGLPGLGPGGRASETTGNRPRLGVY